jgi:methionine-S-sulfoxide reductase
MTVERTVILGGGCFWCTEAIFRAVDGVLDVTSGYAGGETSEPSYEDVVSDRTGHAEVVRVTYDADRLALAELLRVHLSMHDPTHPMKNASHARSVIFTANEADEAVARALLAQIPGAVTELRSQVPFHPAEARHQRYAEKNPDGGYTRAIIAPKLRRLAETQSSPTEEGTSAAASEGARRSNTS